MRLTPFYAFRDNGDMRRGFKLRVQDVLLTVMFGALIFLAHDIWERSFLLGLAILQLVEGRIPFLTTLRGRTVSVVLQLTIVWVLIGYTGGVTSSYYLMLLLPLVSTASYLGVAGTILSSVAAIGAYLSFLLYVNFEEVDVPPEQIHILTIRCLLLAIAAVLVNSLAAAIRTQSAKYKLIAEQLTAAEAAVRRSERLAALGQLSAGLAHELRNPLGSIKGSADLLARSASHDDPMAKELASIISAEVDRTNSLVTRFLDFARPLEPRRESTEITSVIDRAVARAKVDVVRDYAPSLPRLAIDPELMEQVFLNLVTNASQASAPGDPVTVRTREVDEQAEVSVIDRGCGISPDKIETIFNPFVTTKQNGVGLGLAIVAKIVDGHGGKMSVESEPGKGSTFRVLLPIPANS
jgi:two-component system, NtrC family, sensor histidine kinase HydH